MNHKDNHSEVAKLFREDSMEKKNIARSAHKKVTHAGCKLPFRTQEELNALSGPGVTYNLDAPMNWKAFTALPADIQKEYLVRLAKRFFVDESRLPNLLGARFKAVSTYLSNRGIFGVMRAELATLGENIEPKLDAWQQFVDSKWQRPKNEDDDAPAVMTHDIFAQAAAACKDYRKAHNLSQAQLGKMLGVCAATISRTERKAATPQMTTSVLASLNRLVNVEAAKQADENKTHTCNAKKAPVRTDVSPALITEGEKWASLPENLTISGAPAAVLDAIERLFGNSGQKISVVVKTVLK